MTFDRELVLTKKQLHEKVQKLERELEAAREFIAAFGTRELYCQIDWPRVIEAGKRYDEVTNANS